MRLRFAVAVSLTLLAAYSISCAATQGGDAHPRQYTQVVIVELFTSEGCSSCPPADALLRQVHLTQTSSGQMIVGISEHVTYWNNLGWKDPYSDQIFTDRQSAYASRLSPEGPYTPQMVLNGRAQFVGSSNRALQQALLADSHKAQADLRIASVVRHAEGIDLKFSLTGTQAKALEIVAVLTDDTDHSSVLRGENSGRTLQHVSVARSLTQIATVSGDSEQSLHVSFPKDFLHGTDSGHHLVLFAQEPHQGAIVAAATEAI